MHHIPVARLIAAAIVTFSAPAAADEVVLDLDAVLARATAAPDAVSARARVAEAEGRRPGASVRFPANPELEVEAGPRFGEDTSADFGVRLGQSFALGGRRAARRAVVDAEVAHATADADAADREVRIAAALAFVDALYAARVVDATTAALDLATRAADVEARRKTAGDVTDLEAGLARAAEGRARAAVRAADSDAATAVALLAPLIGLAPDDTVVLRGELRPTAAVARDGLATIDARADLRALAAEAEVAAAELRLARANARPELAVWLGYEHEEGAHVVIAGVRLTWPVWDRGQGPRAEARAHASRVAAEVEVTRRAATREVNDALAIYDRAREAVLGFETDVLPVLDDTEALLGTSVDAGAIAIADYLVARKELLDGRREYLDLLRTFARADVTARLIAEVTQ